MGLRSSVYPIDVDVKGTGTAVAIGASVLNNPIVVTTESLNGNSGLFRVYFSLTTAAADYHLEATRVSKGTGATATAILTNGIITSITVDATGSSYPKAPVVAVTGGGGGVSTPPTAILQGGEVVSITPGDTTTPFTSVPTVTITEFNQTAQPLTFNGDNDFNLKTAGYYRFDVGVRPGDTLDFLVRTTAVTGVKEFRVDQIQLGA